MDSIDSKFFAEMFLGEEGVENVSVLISCGSEGFEVFGEVIAVTTLGLFLQTRSNLKFIPWTSIANVAFT